MKCITPDRTRAALNMRGRACGDDQGKLPVWWGQIRDRRGSIPEVDPELIQRFESAPGSFRNFCRVCSSTVPGKAAYLTTLSIPAGLLDDDPGVRPKLHVFIRSKMPWVEINDGLPQYEAWVPGFEPK